MAVSLGAFGAAAISFLYAEVRRRVRRQGRRRASASPDIQAYWSTQEGAVLRARGPHLPPAVPEGGRPEGQEGPAVHAGDRRGWSRGSSRSTRSASTSAARCRGARRRSGSSAPATARSTTASARSAAAPRRAASTTSSSRSPARRSSSTPGVVRHRPADRHRHHRPGRRRPALRRLTVPVPVPASVHPEPKRRP